MKKVILKMDTESVKRKTRRENEAKYSQFYFGIRLNGNTFPRVFADNGGGELNILNEKH